MTIDLTTASVRPAGSDGLASRTAAGFIVLGSAETAALISFVDDNQMEPNLIEQLADQIVALNPETLAMLFTAGGEPYLLAWGSAVASVASSAARFTVTPVAGQLLVHPLALDDQARVVLSNGALDGEPLTAPINLAEGSLNANAVVIDLTGALPEVAILPTLDGLPAVDRVDAEPVPDTQPLEIEEPIADDVIMFGDDDPSTWGPPAAAEMIFADDLDEISDLIDEPQAPGLDVPSVFDTPQTFGALTDEPTEAVAAAVAPALTIPIPPETIETHALVEVATPPLMPEHTGATEVPPEFRRDLNPEPEAVLEPGPTPLPASPMASSTIGPAMVLGVVCTQNHHNHPDAMYCSQCGTKMGVHQTTVLVNGPRPPLGVLVVDDGTTYSIDRDLVLGRDPASHEDVRGGVAAPMVLVDDTLSLSRKHARIVLDEWSVMVCDLGSSNGTWLNRGPNPQEWTQVEVGQALGLEPGDRVRVGGRIVQVELHHVR